MFFDDATKRKPSGKVQSRLALGEAAYGDDARISIAASRHREARSRREMAGPSLLDRVASPSEPAEQAQTAPPAPVAPPMPSVLEQLAEIDRRNEEQAQRLRQQPVTKAAEKAQGKPQATEDNETPHEPSRRTRQNRQESELEDTEQYVYGQHDDGAPLIDPRYVFQAVRNWRSLIAATTMLGGLAGLYIAVNTPKLYFSSATIVIDPRNYKVIENDLNPDVFLSEAALAIVDSQVSLIRSPRVLEKVAAKLSLPNDPEFNGSAQRGLGRFLGVLSGGDKSDFQGTTLQYLAEHMSAERSPKTFVVSVGAYSEDAGKAALIANTIVDVFLEEQASNRSDTAKRTSGELGARLEDLKAQVEAAENKVESFKSENNLVGAQGRLIEDEEILRVNDQLTAARSTTITLNSRAQSAKSATVDAVTAGGLPEEIASSGLTALRSQYVSAKQRQDGLAAKLGPRHPDLQQAATEVESLRGAIGAEINRIRQSIQTDLKRAVETEQALASRLAQVKARQGGSGGAQVALRELEREAASARTVYEQYLLRARETGEQGNINATNIQKISEARAADTPEGASRKLIVLSGAIAGLIAGVGLAVAKGMFDAMKSRFSGDHSGGAPIAPRPPKPKGGGRRRLSLSAIADKLPQRQHAVPAYAPAAPAPALQAAPTPRFVAPQQAAAPDYHPQPLAQPVQQPQPVWHQPQPMPMMQQVPVMQPVPMPVQPVMQPYGYPVPQPVFAPPMIQPVFAPQMMPQPYFAQPMMQQPVFAPQMMPQPVYYPQPEQTRAGPEMVNRQEMRDIRDTLDDLQAELIHLSKRRRSA